MGDMGGIKGFYMRTDEWWGGKEIADAILNYDQVLIFGPTNAKSELRNYLNTDLYFKNIRIDVESVDGMTDIEKDAIVKNHFKNS
jgi:hypothetical protein